MIKNWIKAIFWCIVYVLFVAWVGNFWWLLLLPLIFDAFITKFIPYTWWKTSKNKTVRSIMSWVDAIVFALVAVYFINLYGFQNYQIPTSSLEKTLLVGDFLFVSKASYGPRIPNTPLSMPMMQNTIPVLNTKSYLEKPQWKYRRLRGFDHIKRNDIVVFNFPTGDTVPLKRVNPDYYITCYEEGRKYALNRNYNFDNDSDGVQKYQTIGREIVKNNPDVFGELVYRPVDKRDNYVKRCVGMPGDRLQIVNNQIYINGIAQEEFPYVQFNYIVQTDGTQLTKKDIQALGISIEDYATSAVNVQYCLQYCPSLPLDPMLPAYRLPLTKEMYHTLSNISFVKKIVIEPQELGGDVFPIGNRYGWTRDNFGPVLIPKCGQTFKLSLQTLPIYERVICTYENNRIEVKDGKIFINDIETPYYTFKMDYFWMMGDNRHKSADSRYWGFVPEDHVVGRPVFVWLSLDKDKSWLGGKIRFKRFFKNAER